MSKMMKRALIVGIDDYSFAPLYACVNDAKKISSALSKNQDGSPNFNCKELVNPEKITRAAIREHIEELFSHKADVALFYFAGHGTVNNLGGFLVTQDSTTYDEGVPMENILTLANQSSIGEVVIIIDCCHSGALGAIPAIHNEHAILREGVSVLTASRPSQSAVEEEGSGIFTSLVCEALDGGAADVLGNVTVANVYAFVDQALGAWDQRPLFKSHVSRLISLRKCEPEIDVSVLRLLAKYFENPDDEYPLDPSYEPTEEPRNPRHEKIFAHLQEYRDARLLVPVGEKHLYYAAINSKACKLTALGKFYWKLAKEEKI